mmetsp:Transcript_18491/g.30207  ORF Transcript_18491/g.30207 Transcript_18491/m.30207 type:complete len:327 (-) Transcript_18491:1331-2311(-)
MGAGTTMLSARISGRRRRFAQMGGDFGGQAGVVAHQCDVGDQRPPVGQLKNTLQQIGRDALAGDPMRLGIHLGLRNDRGEGRAVDLVLLRDRVCDQLTAGQAQGRAHPVGLGNLGGTVHPQRGGKPRGARPKGGHLRLPKGDDGHALGFEHFECFGDIQDRLGPGGHDGDRGLAQFQQVGGDVKALLGPLVDPADAPGGKHANSGKPGCNHGGRHRCCTGASGGHANRHIRPAQLCHTFGLCKSFELRVAQAHMQCAFDDGHGCRHRTGGAHIRLNGARNLKVLRIGHAVGDDRAFQRHDRRAAGQSVRNVGRGGKEGHIWVFPET